MAFKMKTVQTGLGLEDIFILLRAGKKVAHFEWASHEYIEYDPDKGITDEYGQDVNASVIMNNSEDSDCWCEVENDSN